VELLSGGAAPFIVALLFDDLGRLHLADVSLVSWFGFGWFIIIAIGGFTGRCSSGTGIIGLFAPMPRSRRNEPMTRSTMCTACHGFGFYSNQKDWFEQAFTCCVICGGSGRIYREQQPASPPAVVSRPTAGTTVPGPIAAPKRTP